MKNFLIILMIIIPLMMTNCGKAKKNLAKETINSYAQAVKEEDERTMKIVFPDILFFKEYPKIDKIDIKEMKVKKENVIASCILYYETGLGKKIEQEIKFLVNTNDKKIIDVSGFLTRKDRNAILESNLFNVFPDLKPVENDMDVNFVKNERKAWNRENAYKYYAKKAIGERTKVMLDIKFNKYTKYGIIDYYNNVRVNLSISNNSDFESRYSYRDDNIEYSYSFPAFIDKSDKLYGCSGEFLLTPKQSITQTIKFDSEYMGPLKKEEITFYPVIWKTEDAISIVNKYYDDDTKKLILSGENDFFSENNDYKIKL